MRPEPSLRSHDPRLSAKVALNHRKALSSRCDFFKNLVSAATFKHLNSLLWLLMLKRSFHDVVGTGTHSCQIKSARRRNTVTKCRDDAFLPLIFECLKAGTSVLQIHKTGCFLERVCFCDFPHIIYLSSWGPSSSCLLLVMQSHNSHKPSLRCV